MVAVYDIYGFHSGEIDAIAKKLEDVLGIVWVAHDSSFIGDYYKSEGLFNEVLKLQFNYFELEQDWMEPEFKQYSVLLYINTSSIDQSNKIEKILLTSSTNDISLLKRKML